jgi:predicted N-acetyltransferase YhbS
MGKEFFVDEFFVKLKDRGNGLGIKLVNFVIDSLLQEEYARLILLTNKKILLKHFI